MDIREVKFFKYNHCFEISHNNRRMIITTDVGPRILFFGFENENILFIDEREKIKREKWKIIGGHRFWVSPETEDAYVPDNDKCMVESSKDFVKVFKLDKKTGLEKSIIISVDGDDFIVKHILINRGEMLYQGGIWALTCIIPEGTIFFPWTTPGEWKMKKIIYWEKWPGQSTNIDSTQFIRGKDLFLIKVNGEMSKVGTTGYEGFLGVSNRNYTFIKKFNFIQGAIYPDDNCAIEIYTSKNFCELETLSPITTLIPEVPLIHIERWKLIDRFIDPSDGGAIRKVLK
ncbi:MAG: hypothetical protein ACP5QT_03565 [Brevinematia bacterium]